MARNIPGLSLIFPDLCSLRTLIAHLQWRVLQAPLKSASNEKELLFSKHIESVRKDSECVFGALKARWRLLRMPVQYHTMEAIDHVVFSCCILHNMLHDYDGRDTWAQDRDQPYEVPAQLREDIERLFAEPGALDARPRLIFQAHRLNEQEVEVEGSFLTLRRQLIEHYAIARAASEVEWLRSTQSAADDGIADDGAYSDSAADD